MSERGVSFTAVLLAGGHSRRMGVDKAYLKHVNGLPFWQRQLQVLDQLDPEFVMISSPQQPDWISDEQIWVKDDLAQSGPIGGIASALSTCSTSHLICLGIDLVEMVPLYLEYFCSCSSNGTGMVPVSDAGWEPLASVLPREAVSEVNECIDSGQYKLQTLMDRLQQVGKIRPFPIPGEELGNYRNINTPEEYERWKQSGAAL